MASDCSREYCNGLRIPTIDEYCGHKLNGDNYADGVKDAVRQFFNMEKTNGLTKIIKTTN